MRSPPRHHPEQLDIVQERWSFKGAWIPFTILLLLITCSSQPPCAPVDERGWQYETDRIVASGACDRYDHVEECPTYVEAETRWSKRNECRR